MTLFVFSAKWSLEKAHLKKRRKRSIKETSQKVAYQWHASSTQTANP